jgi:Amt family ammonium transporter
MASRSPGRGQGGVTYLLFKLVNAFVPLRVSREHELKGRDISQRGGALH